MTDQTPGSELERAYLEPEPFQLQDEVTSLTRDLSASAGLFQRSLDMIGRLQEQLARMAETKQHCQDAQEAVLTLSTCVSRLEGELSEAVELLDQVVTQVGRTITSELREELDTFLARHAQAEQQEARNAEVARESLRPENQRIEPVEPLRVPHPLEAQGAQAGDEDAQFVKWANTEYQVASGEELNLTHRHVIENRKGWMARAAQPAVRKYVTPVSIVTFEKAITEEALAAGFNEPDLSRHEVDGCEAYAQQHIQAAYSGWKLALGLSPSQQAIDLLVEALVAPNTADLPGRIDSFLDSLNAVRGAEHE